MRCAARSMAVALILGLAAGCGADGGDDEGAGEGSSGTGAGSSGGSTEADETGTVDDTAGSTTGEIGEDLGPWESLDERPCPEDSFLTYDNFGGPFMLTYCNSCHSSRLPADMRQGSPPGVDFDGLEDIRARADRIWVRAADQNLTMPPVGPPSAQERTRLGEWLACGAP